MLTAIALWGLLTLVALAALIGIVDGHARQAAWSRIAADRRSLSEYRDWLVERESELDVRQEALDLRDRRLTAREQASSEQERSGRGPTAA